LQEDTRLLTADQVAERLGVPKSWVYARARAGRIPAVRLGRYYRFRPRALEDWIMEQESGACQLGVAP
jgi:excisionase family DNA binding protein